MKKIIGILAAVCMLWSMSSAAFAAEVYTEGGFQYTIEDESVTIVGYFGSESVVTVPAMIAGYPVNRIAPGAFTGTSATTVNLPDTIMEMTGSAIPAGTTVVFDSNTAEPADSSSAGQTPAETESSTAAGTTTGSNQTTVASQNSSGAASGSITVVSAAASADASVSEVESELRESELPAPAKTAAAAQEKEPEPHPEAESPLVEGTTEESARRNLPAVAAVLIGLAAAVGIAFGLASFRKKKA